MVSLADLLSSTLSITIIFAMISKSNLEQRHPIPAVELIIAQSANGRPLALLLNNSPNEVSVWDPAMSNRAITFLALDKKRIVANRVQSGVIKHPAFTPSISQLQPFTATFAEFDLASTFDLKGTKPGRYPYVCIYDDAAPNATARSLGWNDAIGTAGRIRSNGFWIVIRPDHSYYIATDDIKKLP